MKQIKLSNSKKLVLVDDDVFDALNKRVWRYEGGYAKRIVGVMVGDVRRYKSVRMHSEIMGKMEGLEVDHINGNPLDNRRENLRFCTHQQNMMNVNHKKNNTTGFRGVSLRKHRKQSKPWEAVITFNQKKIWLGNFLTKEEAAEAYNKKAKELFGDYIRIVRPK